METLLLIIALAGLFVVLILSAELWHQLRASRDRAARVEALRTLAFSEERTMPALASLAVAHASLIDDFAPEGGANEIAAVPMFAAAVEPPAPARRWYVLAALFGVLGVVAGMFYALW